MTTIKERTEQIERGENIETNKEFRERQKVLAGVSIGKYKLIVSNNATHILLLNKTIDITEGEPEVLSSFEITKKGFDISLRNKIVKELIDLEILQNKKDALKVVIDAFRSLKESYKEKLKEKQAKEYIEKEPDKENFISTSLYIDEEKNIIAEQVYNKNISKFCIYNTKTKEIKYSNDIIDNITYTPFVGEDLTKGLVLLPSKAEDYESEEKLVEEIELFLKKWLGVSEEFYKIAVWYILTTWVYDKFDTINYLRALGDTGSGKSRFLDVIGGLCYKFTLISGAVTPAPVFRLLERWKGTLGIEEADLKESDETNEIIKILNCGFEKNKPVVRCNQNDANIIETFDTFSPKIIATRKEFRDQATEARCLTEIMIENRGKPDTKTSDFYDERRELRNKLLMFRFRNYYKVSVEKALEIDLGGLEPRLKQASRSFLALVWDKPILLEDFKVFLKKYNKKLIEQRSSSYPGIIVNTIAELLIAGERNITASLLSERCSVDVSFRTVGKILRGLNLEIIPKKVEGATKKVLKLEKNTLSILFNRYIPEEETRKMAKISVTEIVVEKQKTVTEVTEVTGVSENFYKLQSMYENKSKKSEGGATPIVGNLGNSVTPAINLIDAKDTLYSMLSNIDMIDLDDFYNRFPPDFRISLEAMIDNLKKEGEVFEPKPGFIKLL